MKKLLCITLLSLFTFTHANDEKLLPELEEFLTVKPLEDKDLEGNIHVESVGMILPLQNYIETSKQFFKDNNEIAIQSQKKGEIPSYRPISNYIPDGKERISINMSPLQWKELYPCNKYGNEQCVDVIINDKERIKSVLNQNKELLERFKAILNSAQFNNAFIFYGDVIEIDLMGGDTELTHSARLLDADSVIKIAEGNINEGLDQLVLMRHWLDLYQAENSESTLIDLMLNVVRIQNLDQVVDSLLNTNLLNNHLNDPRVAFIVRPYSENIRHIIQRMIIQDFKYMLYLDNQQLLKNKGTSDSTVMMANGESLTVKNLNDYFTLITEIEVLDKKGELIDSKSVEKLLKNKNSKLPHDIQSGIETYINRVLEQQNYHQLVYLKYQIMKDKIAYDDIPKFLESMGDLAKNTVTKEPYHFDAKTGVLSTPLPEMKYRPAQVRLGDKEIPNFQVTIQK